MKKIFRRAKFAMLVQKSLEDAISGLADWQNLLQPLIFHLTRISDPIVDQRIKDEPGENSTISTVQNLRQAFGAAKPPTKDSVLFAADNNFWNQRQLIKYTSVEIHKVPRNGRHLLIDAIPCDGRDPAVRRVIQDVRKLAQILRMVDPMKFGIPRCAGIVNVKDSAGMLSKIEMVFKVPQALVNPRSLRCLLLSSDHGDGPINMRIQLAKRLARTVSFVHSGNFVHKNFRPETIMIFDSRGEPNDQSFSQEVGFPLLVGFQRFRSAAGGHTTMMGDTAWEKNIYRHPDRQGQFPEEVYKMEHDIYSLGVCLLEIALWKSFVLYDDNGIPQRSAESERLDKKNGYEVKDMLVTMAREMIPKRLGNRYAEVTISCLKCLDDDDDDDNWDHLDEEGISVGVSYIEKVSPFNISRLGVELRMSDIRKTGGDSSVIPKAARYARN